MFLSEWREFPSAPCLAGKQIWWHLASRCCWNRGRPWHASGLVSYKHSRLHHLKKLSHSPHFWNPKLFTVLARTRQSFLSCGRFIQVKFIQHMSREVLVKVIQTILCNKWRWSS